MNNIPHEVGLLAFFVVGFVVGFGVLGLWVLFILEERKRQPKVSRWLQRQFDDAKLNAADLDAQAKGGGK